MPRARTADEDRPTTEKNPSGLDRELEDLPPTARWREWMGRVEAVIFACRSPVSREILARVVGKNCPLESILDDIRKELRGRPHELVMVAGFRDVPSFEDHDAMRFAHGREPVGDHEHGSAFQQRV